MQCFDAMEFLADPEPRSAPVNMAMDEVILREISVPLLRVYRWERPSVSYGYFEKFSVVEERYAGWEFVRRWTGGGIVPHGEDFTYSLLLPRDCELARSGPAQCYQAIHEAVATAMQNSGIDATIAAACSEKISTACFENAVCHDVMVQDRKVAGAAQRRTRQGLLHQGSIQQSSLPESFARDFAALLATNVIPRVVQPGEIAAASMLAERKYATPEWTRKF